MATLTVTRRRSAVARREATWGYLFILPFMVLFFVFRIVPSLMAFWLSVVAWKPGTGEAPFIGLANFELLLSQPTAFKAFANTFYYALLATPSGIVLALGTAALIHVTPWPRVRTFFQAAYYLPGVVAAVSIAVVWRFIYDYDVGLLNFLLGLLGIEKLNWLGHPSTAMISVVIMEVLVGLGGTIIIFVAALAAIPQDLYDAAKIDGARPWQEFLHITLPLIVPAILYVAVVRTIVAFQVFVPIYLLTQGGPANSTLTVGFLIFRQVFYYAEIGLATATGLVLLLVTLIFTVIQFRWFSSVVEY
jgi:multiple sugar transport system permease protein